MNKWKSAALLILLALTPWSVLVADENSPDDPATLLEPNGPFAVGQTLLEWTDDTRAEPGTENPDDHRRIPVQIWYPAPDGATGEPARYRPHIEAFRSNWGDETVDFFNSVQTAWILEAPVSPNGPFPVFVFSHGWGARSSSHGTFLANVASHGYIVVGINHPYLGRVALANGEVTEPSDSQFDDQSSANEFYAADVTFALDKISQLNHHDPTGRFTGSIDIGRVCAGGHSSGFPAVSGAAVTDNRIQALISFDSGVPELVRREGLGVPILLFRGETDSYTDLFFRGENVHPKGTIYDVDFFRVHRADFFDIVVSGTTHSSVYDEYLFAENDEEREQSVRAHITFDSYTAAFLDHVLNGTDSSFLGIGHDGEPTAKMRIVPAPQRFSP
jgi:hypothetical protein